MKDFLDFDDVDYDGMEMPTPCNHCGKIFDLNDGYGSEKWYPNIIICEPCHYKEEAEIEREEEIENLIEAIRDAEWTLKYSQERLKELGHVEPNTFA